MDEKRDVNSVVGDEALFENTGYIYADNVSEKKQKSSVSRNTIRELMNTC